MLVQRSIYDEAVEIAAAKAVVQRWTCRQMRAHIGPLVSEAQFEQVQRLIQTGIDEGARLVAGGVGRPEGLNRGWFVRPTVFADAKPDMTISVKKFLDPCLL